MNDTKLQLDLRSCKSIHPDNPIYGKVLPIELVEDGKWILVEEEIEEETVLAILDYYNCSYEEPEIVFYEKDLPVGAKIVEKGETEMSTPITVDTVIAAYVNTRNDIKQIEAEAEEKIRPLKEFQVKREQWLAAKMLEEGETSKKTPHGTCYFTTTESVTMGDWDAFFNYVSTTNQYNLLQHAVNKTAALEIMGEKRENPPPPGVNYNAFRTVNVRKA